MTYIIDMIPPSNNKYIGRTNYREYQNIKREWAKIIDLLCHPKPKNPIDKAIVQLTYYFPDRKRRDPDNYSGKMVLDGLVKAGILADDSFGHIQLLLAADYDENNPRTEIKITPLEAIKK